MRAGPFRSHPPDHPIVAKGGMALRARRWFRLSPRVPAPLFSAPVSRAEAFRQSKKYRSETRSRRAPPKYSTLLAPAKPPCLLRLLFALIAAPDRRQGE